MTFYVNLAECAARNHFEISTDRYAVSRAPTSHRCTSTATSGLVRCGERDKEPLVDLVQRTAMRTPSAVST